MGIWNAKPNIRRLWRVRKPARRVFGRGMKQVVLYRRGRLTQGSELARWSARAKEQDRRSGVLNPDRDFYYRPCFERRLPCNA
ncbi:hypothetical protein CJ010_00670 [Azoarcus sp. DD4]|uniref:hypothetical protein n=1 Tax=Azoarcus sp. DD4 TaxID=2027405 RepID=UPI0011276BA6|nr:hypothetical protein [Azoarcus sp. DD4]QDF95168.1 hypothetical protein CJ010_00670 [Azoarcus sp. DD4]